jgi:hypothetical protein
MSHALGKFTVRALQAAGLACMLGLATAGAVQAAVQRVGWVWAYSPSATHPYKVTGSYVYNSTGGEVIVVPLGTGYYEVKFAGLYNGAPSDVQVSAYSSSGYCTSSGWSSSSKSVVAYVSCYDASGNPANSYFTLLYQERSGNIGNNGKGLAFVWANSPTSASYTPSGGYSYNSTGGTNNITRNGTGSYTVNLPGLTTGGGDVQVTAYDAVARCKAGSWGQSGSGTYVNVYCFDSTGAAADEYFDLAYSDKESFGHTTSSSAKGVYAWANNPSPTKSYTMSPTFQYNGFTTGRLTANKYGTGEYTVTIPGSFGYDFSNVLVTGYSGSSNYCNIVDWGSASVNVACYSQGGTPTDSYFDLAFQTAN